MSMKTLLLTCLAFAGTFFASAKEVRYVAANGDDANDGLTERTAWKTVARLVEGLPAGGEGRLRRGDLFYCGRVTLRPGPDAEHRTTLTAWGEGPKPVLSAYMLPSSDPSVWQPAGTNLWAYVPKADKGLRGNVFEVNGNIGFLKVDGKIFARKFFKLGQLSRQWDFYDDHRTLTVWSEKNPAELTKDMKLAPNVRVISFVNHLEVRDIDVRGTGGHGIAGIGCDVRVLGCGFHEIGGSHLAGHGQGTSRYGNGVECWAGSKDVLVKNCSISDVYDVAFTMQGPNPPHSWENVHVEDCVITRCTQAIEIWAKRCKPGIGFKNCTFERNLCVDTSRNWGYEVRPDKANGTPLLLYSMETDTCDLTIRGNRFVNSLGALVCFWRGLGTLPEGYRIIDNTIEGGKDAPICCQQGKDPAAFAARERKIRSENKFVVR